MTPEHTNFELQKKQRIEQIGQDQDLKDLGINFLQKTGSVGYTYNFNWLGLPIIQFPQDIVALQEIIWEVKPDLIIETGIARGGSLALSASMLQLIGGDGLVLGIDIDIRPHNKTAIEAHPMAHRIQMLQGSSVASDVIAQVQQIAASKKRILVLLDSNHTHEHVLAELHAYAGLVTPGSYCIVYDTGIEDMPADYDWKDRPWGKGNNPKTAVWEFLKGNDDFIIDTAIQHKLLITVAPDGYLKRIK